MAPKGPPPPSAFAVVGRTLGLLATVAALAFACQSAYQIRMFAIDGYGRLIHECAPRRRGAARRAARPAARRGARGGAVGAIQG
jgi:hypothetical protein